MLALPLALYWSVCLLVRLAAGERERSTFQLFLRFAGSLLPIALFYHLAHNLQHVFYEGAKLVRVASDPLGYGWDLFGTASLSPGLLLPARVGWTLQVALILIGHAYGILIAHRTARVLWPDGHAGLRAELPLLAAMVSFSVLSLWLVAQPMLMRSAL